MTLTSEQLTSIIFQLATPEYHNLDANTTKLTRIQPYLYCQWPFWTYAIYRGLTHPKRCVLYQYLISTYQRSSVPIVVLSCRNEHSGLFFRLRQPTNTVSSMHSVRFPCFQKVFEQNRYNHFQYIRCQVYSYSMVRHNNVILHTPFSCA